MNPLSAIHQFQDPNLLQRALTDVRTPATIPLNELKDLRPAVNLQALSGETPSSFESVLGHMVHEVSQKQAAAGAAVQGLMSGQGVPLHQAVIAMEEASVSFQLMVEVRNKLLESYQELMRMQI